MRDRTLGRRRFVGLAASSWVWAAAGGCGYSVRAPFDPKVANVHVPIFRSLSFRRDVNLIMTELVIKEIQQRTPYKVVGSLAEAETVLDGTINFADKNLWVENPFNLPRELTAQLNASVNWTHNPPTADELDRGPTVIGEALNFVPEIGETSQTAFYKTCYLLAKQVVGMMERPW